MSDRQFIVIFPVSYNPENGEEDDDWAETIKSLVGWHLDIPSLNVGNIGVREVMDAPPFSEWTPPREED